MHLLLLALQGLLILPFSLILHLSGSSILILERQQQEAHTTSSTHLCRQGVHLEEEVGRSQPIRDHVKERTSVLVLFHQL